MRSGYECIDTFLVHDKNFIRSYRPVFQLHDPGASAPNPDLLFVLTQKVSKKLKTAPASHEKLAFGRLKPSKLATAEYAATQTGQFFNATLTCFSAHRTRSLVSEPL